MSADQATALGGTLLRWAKDTWAWSDHTPAQQVKDMTLSWYYNFRCRTYGSNSIGGHDTGPVTYVEVPVDQAKNDPDLQWCAHAGYAVAQSGDDAGERRLHESGRMTRLSAREGGKAIRDVYLVPAEEWDARPPCGAKWDAADEAAILAKATSLGYVP